MEPRVALVTGGLGGIGRAVCRRLARDGLRVVAADLPADAERQQDFLAAMAGLPVAIESADISLGEECSALVRRIEASHGAIGVLVNGAGITRDASLRKMPEADWDAVLRVNLDSAFHLCRLVVDGMCGMGHGRIVNISSIVGQTGAFGQANYAAAKAGLHGFTMALAREVARKGVTVNSISPGYIQTAMSDAIPAEHRQRIIDGIPVGRIGQPEDVADAVSFLCSDGASYLTGINLPVNGGLFISF
jgi:acetoacetyl-CoA reductase